MYYSNHMNHSNYTVYWYHTNVLTYCSLILLSVTCISLLCLERGLNFENKLCHCHCHCHCHQNGVVMAFSSYFWSSHVCDLLMLSTFVLYPLLLSYTLAYLSFSIITFVINRLSGKTRTLPFFLQTTWRKSLNSRSSLRRMCFFVCCFTWSLV